MTREELAFRAGVAFKTIERIESGQSVPRRATLAALALALGVEPATLLTQAAA